MDQKARDDYKQGVGDSQKGTIERVVNDVTVNHPDTSAYYKGREGEQLDGDKKKD